MRYRSPDPGPRSSPLPPDRHRARHRVRNRYTLAFTLAVASAGLWTAGCGKDATGAEPARTGSAKAPRDDAPSRGTESRGSARATDGGPTERVVSVHTRVLDTETVVERASLPAELLPARRAILAAEVPGTLETLDVEAGDRIRAGDLLAAVDTRALRQRLAEAEAVDRHRRLRFERAQKLLERRSITQVQFLDAQTERDVAAAQLEAARLELEKSRVLAPWSGTVSSTRVEVGDYVQPGMPVVELVDIARLEVLATAPAGDVPFLRTGLPVEIRVDVFPDQVLRGTVSRLGAELDPETRTLDVVAEIENPSGPGHPDGKLRPGLSARVELPRRRIEGAVRIPLDAVVELESRRVVYLVTEGEDGEPRAEQRVVSLGPIVGSNGVVVEDGLASGDRLIVDGQRRVSPGQKVRPEEETSDAGGGGGSRSDGSADPGAS